MPAITREGRSSLVLIKEEIALSIKSPVQIRMRINTHFSKHIVLYLTKM